MYYFCIFHEIAFTYNILIVPETKTEKVTVVGSNLTHYVARP